MLLSPNFTLDELTKSQEAIRLGISNEPSDEYVTNLIGSCMKMYVKNNDVANSHNELYFTTYYKSKHGHLDQQLIHAASAWL